MSSSSWQNEGTYSSSEATPPGSTSATTNVPMAHYPPILEHRFPSSSLFPIVTGAVGSAAHRATSDGAVVAAGTLADSMATLSSSSVMPRPFSTMNMMATRSAGGDSGVSSIAAAAAAEAQTQQQQQQQQQTPPAAEHSKPRVTGSCRIRFCDRHHVATINNAPIISSSFSSRAGIFAAGGAASQQPHSSSSAFGALDHREISATTTGSRPATRRMRGGGPILLELQRLEIDDSRIANCRSSSVDSNRELFRLRTVARSRGNPSLGTSISSTCLDVMTAAPSATNDLLLPSPCATGLTTGALCIHTFGLNNDSQGGGSRGRGSMNSNDMAMAAVVAINDDNDPEDYSSYFECSCNIDYFHIPRHHRPATAVAWQPSNNINKSSSSSLVAIAWASRSSTNDATAAPMNAAPGGGAAAASSGGGGIGIGGVPTSAVKHNPRGGGGVSGGGVAGSVINKTASSGLGGRVGAAAVGGQASDRDYGCFVWDVSQSMAGTGQGGSGGGGGAALPPLGHKRSSSSSSPAGVGGAAPIAKLAHQTGVASLAWVLGDSSLTLAVGGQLRNVQIFDLRISGQTASPPITFYAHNFAVHGIQADPHRPHMFATFCSVHKEPVKIWDARRLDSDLCQIKVGSAYSSSSTMDEYGSNTTPVATGVSAIQWSTFQPGSLSIAVGDTIYDYDTSSSSRPIHKETVYARSPISDFCLYRQEQQDPKTDSYSDDLLSTLYPRRTLVVHSDRSIHDLAMHRLAPMDLSRRDGRLVHGLGRMLWVGPTNQGPAAMEKLEISADEDISATMMRRARCLHDAKYSMDTKSNIKVLVEDGIVADGSALLRLWSWVERVEALCAESWQDETSWEGWNWPAKGLIEAGAIELLRMDTACGGAGSRIASSAVDKEEFCVALSCKTYHSPGRRAAMTSCGWAGKFDLTSVLGECEGLGEFERSAALAVWHADIGAAVEALQRGAAAIRNNKNSKNVQYAETLELVSLCIAGYRGGDLNSPSSSIWRRACANLMQRSDLSVKNQSRVVYMTGLLKFLMSLGSDTGYQEVLFDQSLSLCDRAAFACRFLEREKLQQFLGKCITDCQTSGNIEGVTITGIEKEGMKILQSYVDRYADVQTASLITSRVILPPSWIDERRTSAEWLGAYRGLLNTWQMWQSRAMFDVDRAELLRQVKARQLAADSVGVGGRGAGGISGRRPYAPPLGRKLSRQQVFDPDVQAAVPAQIDARCNYCSAPLGLRQRDSTEASQWLSKMKPVLSCCPQCRKPLPRCSICMLSLGTLNPYMELTKSRQPRSASGRQSPDDYLSTMTNLPFAEWPSWCLKCRHVGHTHHLVGWFAKHDVCPVSGCNCRCQFDGILKLNRPALAARTRTFNEASVSCPIAAADTTTVMVAAEPS